MRYSRIVALFRVGDRIASIERPDEAGTITAIVADDPSGAVYHVNWDHKPASAIDEAVLVRANWRRNGPHKTNVSA
jgi:hypothetical protein